MLIRNIQKPWSRRFPLYSGNPFSSIKLGVPFSVFVLLFITLAFFYAKLGRRSDDIPIRFVIAPSSNKEFHCSVCRVRRPCLTSDHRLSATSAEMDIYRSFARKRVCEFRQEPDGRVYVLGQLSSKKTYIIEREHLSEPQHETFRYEDVLNLATYSPYLPSFVWTVYARALFLQQICWIRFARIKPSLTVDCDVSRPSLLLPSQHQGLAWFKPLLRQTQAHIPALVVRDDDRFSQESSNASSSTCFNSAIFTDCLEERVTKQGEFYLQGGSFSSASQNETDGLKALIITRKNTRRMKNGDTISSMISNLLKSSGVNHTIEMVCFEDLTFSEQQRLIQKSSLVIASHGAALGQIAYSPRNALVVDIMPFGYHFIGFQVYAAWSNVTYHQSLAEPDFETMMSCLGRKKEYLQAWSNLTKLDQEHYYESVPEVSGIYGIRRCARAQRLMANVTNVMNVVQKWLPSYV